MHDIADLERRGIPGVVIASSEFVDAATAQVTALGVDVARVFIPHPIQDRTDDEMRSLADDSVVAILEKITRGPS